MAAVTTVGPTAQSSSAGIKMARIATTGTRSSPTTPKTRPRQGAPSSWQYLDSSLPNVRFDGVKVLHARWRHAIQVAEHLSQLGGVCTKNANCSSGCLAFQSDCFLGLRLASTSRAAFGTVRQRCRNSQCQLIILILIVSVERAKCIVSGRCALDERCFVCPRVLVVRCSRPGRSHATTGQREEVA